MKRLGMWIWPQSLYEEGADRVMERCAAFGVTDLFLLVKGLAGKVCYHRTRLGLPLLYPHRDILGEALLAAHRRDIRLHAWFTSANDAAYKERHPESGNAHFLDGRNNNVIRMADPGYGEYMTALVTELFATYAVDGLHLDYIRYNHISNGWAQEDQEAMRARGIDVEKLQRLMRETFYDARPRETLIFDAYRDGDPDVLAFAQYRRDTVVTFAGRIIAAARTHRPGLPVSAALMPEGAYPDIAFSDLHYGQNYRDAAKLYDLVLPMAYHVEYKQQPSWVADVAMGSIRRGNRTLIGLQAYGVATAQDTEDAMDAAGARDDPMLEGMCLFRYGEAAADGVMQARENRP